MTRLYIYIYTHTPCSFDYQFSHHNDQNWYTNRLHNSSIQNFRFTRLNLPHSTLHSFHNPRWPWSKILCVFVIHSQKTLFLVDCSRLKGLGYPISRKSQGKSCCDGWGSWGAREVLAHCDGSKTLKTAYI